METNSKDNRPGGNMVCLSKLIFEHSFNIACERNGVAQVQLLTLQLKTYKNIFVSIFQLLFIRGLKENGSTSKLGLHC